MYVYEMAETSCHLYSDYYGGNLINGWIITDGPKIEGDETGSEKMICDSGMYGSISCSRHTDGFILCIFGYGEKSRIAHHTGANDDTTVKTVASSFLCGRGKDIVAWLI